MEKTFYPCEHDYEELETLICEVYDNEPPSSISTAPSDLEVYNSIFCH